MNKYAICEIFLFFPLIVTALVSLQQTLRLYQNPAANFTFAYPETWEVAYEAVYETAAGHTAEKFSVKLKPIGNEDPNDAIRINPRQFACSDGRCEEIEGNVIGTYSRNPEIIVAYEIVVETFSVAKN